MGKRLREWIHRALGQAPEAEPAVDAGRKLLAIRRAYEHEFPTGDIEVVLETIERGYRTQTED